MLFRIILALTLATIAGAVPGLPLAQSRGTPKCRFSLSYTQEEILKDPSSFISDVLYWEGHFHQNNVSYNSFNGMSYDGTLLDENTGLATAKHPFSAASKEALQIMLYAHAIAGSPKAARFLSPENPEAAPDVAVQIMTLKLKTYLQFNETYPGFGGFLPWYTGDSLNIVPTWDWVNRVPALDNGELIWAVYSAVEAMATSSNRSYQSLAEEWQAWLDYTKRTAAKIFYAGKGVVCAVTDIGNQSLQIDDPHQTYACEGSGTLNDPYEGELFTWWLYFFGGVSQNDKNLLWEVKRPQLVSIEYNIGGVGPITVQQVMEMPYYDVDLVKRLYYNAERARTCNSVVTRVSGMFASVNNSTDPTTGQIIGYISNAGIPSIASQMVQELDVITPYSVFPVVLLDKAVGMAWWKSIADGKKMQNPYGSSESTRVDGTEMSSFVSWDSKITTVNAILGGVKNLVRQKMKTDGIYDEFIAVTKREYGAVFQNVNGENISLCLPSERVPDKGLVDYTQCQ